MTQPAFRGPYTDPNITVRGPYSQTPDDPDTQEPRKQQSATRVYDVEGTDRDGPFADHDPPPHAPNSWLSGRDPYKNDGMVGQDFFKNS